MESEKESNGDARTPISTPPEGSHHKENRMDSRFCERPVRTKGEHKARTRPEGRPGCRVRGGKAANCSEAGVGDAPPDTAATTAVTVKRPRRNERGQSSIPRIAST